MNGSLAPVLASWTSNAFFVKRLGDLDEAITLDGLFKDLAYDMGLVWLYFQCEPLSAAVFDFYLVFSCVSFVQFARPSK
jgi:hypothetical protein